MAWNEEIKKTFKYCGEKVYIGLNCIFTNPSEVVLHDRVRIDPFGLFTTGLEVKSNSHITSHVVISGGSIHNVSMGEWTFIGYGSKLFCGSEDYSGKHGPVGPWGSNEIRHGDISIEDFGGIASDVMLFPGVRIPIGTTIGAKSLVHTKNRLDTWSIYYGVPLEFRGKRDEEQVRKLSKDPFFIKG